MTIDTTKLRELAQTDWAKASGKWALLEAAAEITALRAEDLRVGVLAVDPSSPFSGGALLGDRIRMQEHATDPGVFIRSMATRGHLGGLSLATPEAIRLLDAVGRRTVLVETVGVGQVEVDAGHVSSLLARRAGRRWHRTRRPAPGSGAA